MEKPLRSGIAAGEKVHQKPKVGARAWLLEIPLLLAVYLNGMVIRFMEAFYADVLDNALLAVVLILALLGTMLFLVVAAGTLYQLLRPIGLCVLAAAASSVALILGWGFSPWSAAGGMVFLVYGCYFALSLDRETKEWIHFSPSKIGTLTALLLTGVCIAASISVYKGAAERVVREGFELPEPVWVILVDSAQKYFTSLEPEVLQGTDMVPLSGNVDAILRGMISNLVIPYLEWLPFAYASLFFLGLERLQRLMAGLGGQLLRGVFPILFALGMAKRAQEAPRAERIIPG
jgi:hypothetical protein